MALLVCWVAYPLLLSLLSLGCGLLLERAAGALPGVLLVPAGLAVAIAAASLATTNAATAEAATPLVVALAFLGFVLSRRRGSRVEWWTAGAAVAVFAVY